MALRMSTGCMDGLANLQGFSEIFNGGSIKIFTGESPGVEFGVTGVELVSGAITLSSSGNGAVAARFASTAGATGTAGYFRLSGLNDNPYINSNGTAVRADGVCGVNESFCEMLFTNAAMTSGENITVFGSFKIPE